MFLLATLSLLLRYTCADQDVLQASAAAEQNALPDFTFSRNWRILGPFQIGTREIPWSADPLELYGGFRSLEYDTSAIFATPLAFNGTTSWTEREAYLSYESNDIARAVLSVGFPEIDWQWLRDTYGWAALQWQAWARGDIFVENEVDVLILNAEGILEFYLDDVHYYGGDFYGYKKAPLTLRLKDGAHRLDVKLVRDIRSMGGLGEPTVDVRLELQQSRPVLVRTDPDFDEGVLISDVIGGAWGPLAGSYASVTVRNDAATGIEIDGIVGMTDVCELQLLQSVPIRLVPGQTRPISFQVGCVPSYDRRINTELVYRMDHSDTVHKMHLGVWPEVLETMYEPHKVTYFSPGGMVSYTILRPPSPNAQCGNSTEQSLPILIALHGAGLEADDDIVKNALEDLPDLCAWVLIPTGVTPWSGDDWHVWGLADVEAAVAAIPRWIEEVEWTGPGVDVDRWLISGHSNGGQGTWYVLTHRPDKIIAAAAVSAYSSIQNYVPYTWWHTADPGREAVIQAALLNYRHELLLENAQGIPVVQQHGSRDDNVPVYNGRLLHQRIQQAGADSVFFEVPGRNHYWVSTLKCLLQSD
jgi:predicted esterase